MNETVYSRGNYTITASTKGKEETFEPVIDERIKLLTEIRDLLQQLVNK